MSFLQYVQSLSLFFVVGKLVLFHSSFLSTVLPFLSLLVSAQSLFLSLFFRAFISSSFLRLCFWYLVSFCLSLRLVSFSVLQCCDDSRRVFCLLCLSLRLVFIFILVLLCLYFLLSFLYLCLFFSVSSLFLCSFVVGKLVLFHSSFLSTVLPFLSLLTFSVQLLSSPLFSVLSPVSTLVVLSVLSFVFDFSVCLFLCGSYCSLSPSSFSNIMSSLADSLTPYLFLCLVIIPILVLPCLYFFSSFSIMLLVSCQFFVYLFVQSLFCSIHLPSGTYFLSSFLSFIALQRFSLSFVSISFSLSFVLGDSSILFISLLSSSFPNMSSFSVMMSSSGLCFLYLFLCLVSLSVVFCYSSFICVLRFCFF